MLEQQADVTLDGFTVMSYYAVVPADYECEDEDDEDARMEAALDDEFFDNL